MTTYRDFIEGKLALQPPTGIDAVSSLPGDLAPFQSDLTAWALRRGRAAIFAGTGLGKTRMELAYGAIVAAHTGKPTMILTPLAVAPQTVCEGARVEIPVTLCREDTDVREGVNVANYERLHKFDPSRFGAIILDESSIIKHHDAKTLRALEDAFAATQFKLCATATPAPNDFIELGTHAQFLGICTRAEMLAEFFVHDGGETQTWRLKGHARSMFWRWVASWAALVSLPSDLGYPDDGYILPPLTVTHHTIAADPETTRASGLLLPLPAETLMERRAARRASLSLRVAECVDLVCTDRKPWVVWCDLNAESEALTETIADAVEVRGSDDTETKESRLHAFSIGAARVIVTKPSIAGFGLNWQHCARIAFVGVTDSFEAYFQAVRRCWRFGQTRPVEVHIFASELEGNVIANLQRKERDANVMAEALAVETRDAVRESVRGSVRHTNAYDPTVEMTVPVWLKTEAA